MPANPKLYLPPGASYQNSKGFFDTLYGNPAQITEKVMETLQRWIQNNGSLLKASGSCAVCGKDVKNKGVIDRFGRAGRGKGVVLCSYHAMQSKIDTKTAQLLPKTIEKLNPKKKTRSEDKGRDKVEAPSKGSAPDMFEAFVGGWEAPNMSYEHWKDRYFTKGRRPQKHNWFQKMLLPPSLRKRL